MSLVNEALRRARHEATRQEAIRKGLPVPPLEPASRREGRSGSVAILIVVGSALGVAFVAGGALLLGGLRRAETGPATIQVEATPAAAPQRPAVEAHATLSAGPDLPATAAATNRAGASRAGRSQPAAGAESAEPQPTAAAVKAAPSAIAAGEPLTREGSLAAREKDSGQAPGAVRAEAQPPVPEPAAELWFVRLAELPAGVTIDLGGIAWSETGPFALLNKRVLGPGEFVEGYRVVRIDPGQVELEADGETVYIRLK